MDYPPTALTRSIKNGNTKKAAGVGRVGYVFVPIDRASDRSSCSRRWMVRSNDGTFEVRYMRDLPGNAWTENFHAWNQEQGLQSREPRNLGNSKKCSILVFTRNCSSLHLCPTRRGSQLGLEVNHPRPQVHPQQILEETWGNIPRFRSCWKRPIFTENSWDYGPIQRKMLELREKVPLKSSEEKCCVLQWRISGGSSTWSDKKIASCCIFIDVILC